MPLRAVSDSDPRPQAILSAHLFCVLMPLRAVSDSDATRREVEEFGNDSLNALTGSQ